MQSHIRKVHVIWLHVFSSPCDKGGQAQEAQLFVLLLRRTVVFLVLFDDDDDDEVELHVLGCRLTY